MGSEPVVFVSGAGFATVDDKTGELCVGLRQCYSRVGLPGGHWFDVPLELRCRQSNSSSSSSSSGPLATASTETPWQFGPPEFLFNGERMTANACEPARIGDLMHWRSNQFPLTCSILRAGPCV